MWKIYRPKSKSDAEIGVPPAGKCFSSRLKLRGRTEMTPAGAAALFNAFCKLAWLSRQLGQVGDRQLSKSAIKVTAPALRPRATSGLDGGQASITSPSA